MTDYQTVPTYPALAPSEPLGRRNAMTAREFHPADACAQTVAIGPKGGRTMPRHVENWRRNGATQTWKTRPAEFRVPVKYGLRSYGNLTDYDAGRWHTGRAEDCTIGTLRASIAAAWPEFDR
jgi:hypothetical protein